MERCPEDSRCFGKRGAEVGDEIPWSCRAAYDQEERLGLAGVGWGPAEGRKEWEGPHLSHQCRHLVTCRPRDGDSQVQKFLLPRGPTLAGAPHSPCQQLGHSVGCKGGVPGPTRGQRAEATVQPRPCS